MNPPPYTEKPKFEPVTPDWLDHNHPHYAGGSINVSSGTRRSRKKTIIILGATFLLVVIAIATAIGVWAARRAHKLQETNTVNASETVTITTQQSLSTLPTLVANTTFVTSTSTSIPTPTPSSIGMPLLPADKACMDMKMGHQDSAYDCHVGCDPQGGECINWNDSFWCALPCSTLTSAIAQASPQPTPTAAPSLSPSATPTQEASPLAKECVIPYDQENYQSSEHKCRNLCSGQDDCVQWQNNWYCAVPCYDGSKPRAGGSVCAPWVAEPDCPLSDKNRGQ